MKLHSIAASLFVAACLCANVHADETRTEGLNFELTPYFWAAGVEGKVSANGQSIDFDRSFQDVINNTDAAFMGLAVISYDRFVLYADYDFIGLSDDAKTERGLLVPTGTNVKGELDLNVGSYAGGYRFNTFGKNTIDVLVGAQLTDLEPKVKILGQHFDSKSNVTDTVMMLRPSFQFAERWRFNPTFTYGVSGDSDKTYTLMPQLQYQFSDSFAARFGYKKIHYEFDDDNSKTRIDISGAFIGVGWTFPTRSERVVAAPPPPAPAPVAAAPKDSDGDGVIDPDDRCPNTPRGTKVDASGCPLPVAAPVSFDLTVEFAFNSAEINDLSFRELRKAMTFMREHPTTKALVEGNTDSIGGEAYNLKLSERRAIAVKDVLVKSDIDADRITTVGYGETKPVASNDTEEGRAKNRRVSIVVSEK